MLHSELIKIYEKNGFDEVVISEIKGKKTAHYILVGRSDTLLKDIPPDACVLRVPLTSAVLDSEVCRDIFDLQHDVAENVRVFFRHVIQGWNMFLRND